MSFGDVCCRNGVGLALIEPNLSHVQRITDIYIPVVIQVNPDDRIVGRCRDHEGRVTEILIACYFTQAEGEEFSIPRQVKYI